MQRDRSRVAAERLVDAAIAAVVKSAIMASKSVDLANDARRVSRQAHERMLRAADRLSRAR